MPGKGLDLYPAGNERDPQACCLRWPLTKVPATLLSGWAAGWVLVHGSRPRELRGQSEVRPSRFDSCLAQTADNSRRKPKEAQRDTKGKSEMPPFPPKESSCICRPGLVRKLFH